MRGIYVSFISKGYIIGCIFKHFSPLGSSPTTVIKKPFEEINDAHESISHANMGIKKPQMGIKKLLEEINNAC